MRTPIGHHTIAAVRGVASSAVADNGIIWNARCDRELVHFEDKAVLRRKRIDAMGNRLIGSIVWPVVTTEIAEMGMDATISGIFTRLAQIRPIQLIASSLHDVAWT